MVVGANHRHRQVEHIANLVADEVVDGLHIELGGQSFLDAVDDGQLFGALFRLPEKALGFVEEAGVLKGGAQ